VPTSRLRSQKELETSLFLHIVAACDTAYRDLFIGCWIWKNNFFNAQHKADSFSGTGRFHGGGSKADEFLGGSFSTFNGRGSKAGCD
jgi:hypothetical protein